MTNRKSRGDHVTYGTVQYTIKHHTPIQFMSKLLYRTVPAPVTVPVAPLRHPDAAILILATVDPPGPSGYQSDNASLNLLLVAFVDSVFFAGLDGLADACAEARQLLPVCPLS